MTHVTIKEKEVGPLVDKFLQEKKLQSEDPVDVDLNENEIVIRFPLKRGRIEAKKRKSRKEEIMRFAGIWSDFTEEENRILKEILAERKTFRIVGEGFEL